MSLFIFSFVQRSAMLANLVLSVSMVTKLTALLGRIVTALVRIKGVLI